VGNPQVKPMPFPNQEGETLLNDHLEKTWMDVEDQRGKGFFLVDVKNRRRSFAPWMSRMREGDFPCAAMDIENERMRAVTHHVKIPRPMALLGLMIFLGSLLLAIEEIRHQLGNTGRTTMRTIS
jgi:hypothetical protein